VNGSKGNERLKIPFIRFGNRWRRTTSRPLASLRLVVTMPASNRWYGRDQSMAKDHELALRSLGAEVFAFDTEPFFQSDRSTQQRQIDDVRRFRPDAAISSPHATFATAIRWVEDISSENVAANANNVFLDLLQLPTVLYWDHVLTQAMYSLRKTPSGPDDSSGGVIAELRRLFNHSRAFHFFPDSGHIAEVNRLGLGSFDASNHYVPGVSHKYVEYGERLRWRDGHDASVAFFGNLWLTAATRIRYPQAELMEVRRQALDACALDWELSPYKAYSDAIGSLSSDLRAGLRLDLDQTFYWLFLDQEITRVANGEPRLRKLRGCRRPIAYFGGFADPESRQIAAAAGFVIAKDLPPDERLAAALQRTGISLDAVTAPFINGFSRKLLACFASGGFMLTTRKVDIASALGDPADAIGFSSDDELATKVEHYLSSDRERGELANQIATLVRRNYSNCAMFARTVPLALERIRMR
jgi:hypothetical protein